MSVMLDMSPPNGKPTRTVTLTYAGAVFQDHLNPHDAFEREQLIKRAAAKFNVQPAELATLDDMLISEATRPAEIIGKPRLVKASDVERRTVEWLWEGRLPRGKLSLIVGDPDIGKTCLFADCSARLTRGWPWPDGAPACGPGSVIICTAEDGLEDTLRPRLEVAGADLDRVQFLTGVEAFSTEADGVVVAPLSLARNIQSLRAAVKSTPDCLAVFLDPLSAFMGEKVDSHKDANVRWVLGPVADLAEQLRVGIIGILHLNKAAGQAAAYRTMGSVAFVAAARAVWGVVRDKTDREKRLFLRVKCNLARPKPGLSYTILEQDGQPVVAWSADPVDIDVDKAMAPEDAQDRCEREDAREWLRATLSDGPQPAADMYRAAKEVGHSKRTIERAKQELGVMSYREGFIKPAKWVWRLPDSLTSPKVATPPQHKSVATFEERGDLWSSGGDDSYDDFMSH